MLLNSCHLALWTACCLFWHQNRDQADANWVGRSELKAYSPWGCPRAWRCLLQGAPSGAPPDLCECAPCAVIQETKSTVNHLNQGENVYLVRFISEPSCRPEPDARRCGNRVIVSMSAARKKFAMWQMNILQYNCYNVAKETVRKWKRKWVLC